MKQNGTKLIIGIAEVLYFGFFCVEPQFFPNIQPPESCEIPFTTITCWYTGMILFIMLPLRIFLQSRRKIEPEKVNWYFGIITVIHMFLALGWFIFALYQLKNASSTCWHPFFWQNLNYFLILIITLAPALTLALAIVMFVCCLPCICDALVETLRDDT